MEFDASDAALSVSFAYVLALCAARSIARRRYPPIDRDESCQMLSIVGFLRASAFFGSGSRATQLCLIGVNAALAATWAWRCEERRRLFAVAGGKKASAIALSLSIAQPIAALALRLPIRTFEIVVAIAFLVGWIGAIAASLAIERRIPRPHRQRELAIAIGALTSVAAAARAFLPLGVSIPIAAAVQAAIATRALGTDLRRAILREDCTSFYEAVYRSRGELRGAIEVLRTPLRDAFLDHCEAIDPDVAVAYRKAADRARGAVVDDEPDVVDADRAARALDRHWDGFAEKLASLTPGRTTVPLEDEGSASSEWDE